jgi:DNA polymerase-3 subunit epsilon
MFAIIDVESTGGDPKRDRMMEIAILIHNGKRVIEEFATLINPEVLIQNPYVINLTGITNDMVQDSPTFAELAPKIMALTENRILVGHNVRFDYTALIYEFKRLGISFRRRNVDTQSLAKRLIPDLPSYGLGKLCDAVGISHDSRHRAFGDAAATAELFDHLMKINKDSVLKEALREEIADATLPQNISREIVDELPEDTGVYYFKDEQDKILYIGKSLDIRARILSHFTIDLHSTKHILLKKKIHKIDHFITGNELIALLHESTEIKRYMPEFNVAEKKKKYKYGVYKKIDTGGFLALQVKLLNGTPPIMSFSNKRNAETMLFRMGEEFRLCSKKLGIDKSPGACLYYDKGFCDGACTKEIGPEEYNFKVENAIGKYFFDSPDFAIISDGRNPLEKGVVLIKESQYAGFGFFETQILRKEDLSMEFLLQSIQPKQHHPDLQKIIHSYLKKNTKKVSIVAFNRPAEFSV